MVFACRRRFETRQQHPAATRLQVESRGRVFLQVVDSRRHLHWQKAKLFIPRQGNNSHTWKRVDILTLFAVCLRSPVVLHKQLCDVDCGRCVDVRSCSWSLWLRFGLHVGSRSSFQFACVTIVGRFRESAALAVPHWLSEHPTAVQKLASDVRGHFATEALAVLLLASSCVTLRKLWVSASANRKFATVFQPFCDKKNPAALIRAAGFRLKQN